MEVLPIGSIVLLKGASQRLIIIGRCLKTVINEKECFFDYAGVIYPQGLLNDAAAYFNAEEIDEIFFKGYSDASDVAAVKGIRQFWKNHPEIVRGME